MPTPTLGAVYIETSVVSYLTARASTDLSMAARQLATLEWWTNHRQRYRLVTSELTLTEARQGDRAAADRRLAALRGIPLLPITAEAQQLTDALIDAGAVPAASRIDAAHIAVSAVHGIDYLLTWNFRHIANVRNQALIFTVCQQQGYTSPGIGAPSALMGDPTDG